MKPGSFVRPFRSAMRAEADWPMGDIISVSVLCKFAVSIFTVTFPGSGTPMSVRLRGKAGVPGRAERVAAIPRPYGLRGTEPRKTIAMSRAKDVSAAATAHSALDRLLRL